MLAMGADKWAGLSALSQRYDLSHTLTAEEITLSQGPVELIVRLQGGAIMSLQVGGKFVLRSAAIGNKIQPAKLGDATITMGPPGPGKKGQPQHGNWRRTIYLVTGSGPGWLELTAFDPDRELLHVKTFHLLPDGLQLTDRFVNLGDPGGQGMGEHYYLATPGVAAPSRIRILDDAGSDLRFTGRLENGTDLTGTLATFLPTLQQSGTVSVSSFGEALRLDVPGIGRLLLTASAMHEELGVIPVDWWLWRRRGSATSCFEPVAGTSTSPGGLFLNDLIRLGHNQVMQLVSTVRRISLSVRRRISVLRQSPVRVQYRTGAYVLMYVIEVLAHEVELEYEQHRYPRYDFDSG